MLYMFLCIDKAASAEVRAGNRAAHLSYLEAAGERVFCAGPLLSEDGAAMVGSLLVVDCADRAAADDFARNDPYALAGLFERVDIRPWRKVLPRA